jgi:hypothetical protein
MIGEIEALCVWFRSDAALSVLLVTVVVTRDLE